MPIVKMPDGQMVDMPEQPSAEQLDALSKLHPEDTMSMSEKVLRRLTAGFGKASGAAAGGLVNLANMNPIVAALRARGAMGAKDPSTLVPQAIDAVASNTTGEAQRYFGEIGDKAKMNPYPASFIEGVGGAVANPLTAVAPVQSVVSAGTGNVGGELAARTLGEGPMQRLVGSFVGSLLGGGAVNKIGQASPNTMTLAKESMEGITPEQVNAAKSFMEASAAKGVKIDLAQALEATGVPASNLTTVRNVLANNKHGNQVQALLRNQPQDLEALAGKTVDALPGDVVEPGAAANGLQEAATKVIQSAKDARGKAWQQDVAQGQQALANAAQAATSKAQTMMQASGTGLARAKATMGQALDDLLAGRKSPQDFMSTIADLAKAQAGVREADAAMKAAGAQTTAVTAVPPSTILRVASNLGKLAADRPNTGEGAKLLALQKALFDENGHPITDPEQLNRILVSEANKLKAPDLSTSGVSAGQAKWLGGQIQQIRDQLGDTFAPVRVANKGFAKTTAEVIDPLKQSLVGQFATPRGYKPDVAAAMGTFQSLMQRGEDPGAATSAIAQFGKQLAAKDPQALPDAVKTYVSGEIGKAFSADTGAAISAQDAASRVWSALFGNRNKYNGLKQAVAASAEGLGQKPADVVRGLNNFAQIVQAAKQRPASVGGLQRQEVFDLGGKSYGADAMRVFGFLPFEKAARGVENRIMASTFKNFDKLLTTPEGAAKLAELGKAPIMSKRAILIFNSIGAGERGLEQGLANLEEPAGK